MVNYGEVNIFARALVKRKIISQLQHNVISNIFWLE